GYSVEPDLDLAKFQSRDISHSNYGRYTDRVLDDLYQKQSRALDPEERKRYVREFERRLLDEEAHTFITLQWHRIVPYNSKVRGWAVQAEPLSEPAARHGVARRVTRDARA